MYSGHEQSICYLSLILPDLSISLQVECLSYRPIPLNNLPYLYPLSISLCQYTLKDDKATITLEETETKQYLLLKYLRKMIAQLHIHSLEDASPRTSILTSPVDKSPLMAYHY